MTPLEHSARLEAAMRPKRNQRKRTKGWRMPAGTVYVGRPTKWGNPHDWRDWLEVWPFGREASIGEVSREDWCRDRAAQAFEEDIADGLIVLDLDSLRGCDLACWCPLNHPCHADVLLKLANAP